MSSVVVGLIIFAVLFAGVLIGIALRKILPEHHLGQDTRETVKIGAGLIGTMSALVLGLLVASAKSSYDVKRDELTHMSSQVLMLDKVLAHFGPEAHEAREMLRESVTLAVSGLWHRTGQTAVKSGPTSPTGERLYDMIQQLPAKTDLQRRLADQAQSILSDMAKTRMLLYQQSVSSISVPFLIVVVFWLMTMFISFGLFAPANGTAILTLLVCALSVAGALYLVLELDQPFDGLIRLPSTQFDKVLTLIGK